ncbi:MAG: hypothetical protein ABIJ15_00230 [bacterium]
MKKRIQFFAKPKIQLKYVFITLILVVVTAAVSMMVMDHIIYNSSILDGVPDRAAQLLINEVRGGVMVVSVFILVMAFVQATIFFHRLIGPVVAIEKTLDIMREGYFGGSIELRKHDELKDIAEKIEDMGIKISQEIKISKQAITGITERINGLKDKMSESDYRDIKEKLEGLLPFFKEHLGPPAK